MEREGIGLIVFEKVHRGSIKGFDGKLIPIYSAQDAQRFLRNATKEYGKGRVDLKDLKRKLKLLRSMFQAPLVKAELSFTQWYWIRQAKKQLKKNKRNK